MSCAYWTYFTSQSASYDHLIEWCSPTYKTRSVQHQITFLTTGIWRWSMRTCFVNSVVSEKLAGTSLSNTKGRVSWTKRCTNILLAGTSLSNTKHFWSSSLNRTCLTGMQHWNNSPTSTRGVTNNNRILKNLIEYFIWPDHIFLGQSEESQLLWASCWEPPAAVARVLILLVHFSLAVGWLTLLYGRT